jgi:ankyrin repeat protein
MEVCRGGTETAVTAAIASGGNPNFTNPAGKTPLHVACVFGNLAAVRVLTRMSSVNERAVDQLGRQPFHIAATTGQTAVALYLVHECGVDVNARTGQGWCALHRAVRVHSSCMIVLHSDRRSREKALAPSALCTSHEYVFFFSRLLENRQQSTTFMDVVYAL